LLGPDHLAFGLREFEFDLDLPTLVSVDGVPQLQRKVLRCAVR
jgi:hypothetical protein